MKFVLKNWLLNNVTLKTTLLFVGLFYFNIAYTQVNLVPNGSFEIIDTCPYTGSQLYFAKPWYAPQNNSTELIAKCAIGYPSTPCISSLACNSYFQYPKNGSNYTAIWTYQGNNYREYMQIKLIDTLKVSKCYFIQFFANMPNHALKYSSNGIGAYLSNKMDTQMIWWNGIDPTILPHQPQVMKKGNPIITDTLRWTPISGIYVSNGTECFLTIGCFTKDSLLDTLNVNASGYGGAYYFIDDVSLIEATPQNMQHELALHDTTIIQGTTIKIGDDEITGVQYAWYVNGNFIDTTGIITIHPTTQTTYIRQMIWCGYTWTDTVVVNVSTGVEQFINNNEKLMVYPNPCGEKLLVTGYQSRTFGIGNTLEITDVLGRVCTIPPFERGLGGLDLNVSALPSGIYFIKASDTNGNSRNGKFVKE
jgi:hypothetical protein